jgi:hypothetical protein
VCVSKGLGGGEARYVQHAPKVWTPVSKYHSSIDREKILN